MLTRRFFPLPGAQQIQFQTAVFPGGDGGSGDNVTLVEVSATSLTSAASPGC